MLGGFVDRKREVEQENIRQSDLAQQRESRVYETLLSSDDPEIQHMALSGLLESSQPRSKAKGLKGWIGERTASPTFAKLQSLINTPKTVEHRTLPTTSMTGMVNQMPEVQPQLLGEAATGAPAAQPAGNAVTPEGQAAQPPPRPTYQQTGGTAYATQEPRHIFLSAVDKYKQEAVAKAGADIEGDIQAYTPYLGRQGAIDRVLLERGLKTRGTAPQHVAIELPSGEQRMAVFANGQYLDPDTMTPFYGAQPLQHTASTSMGVGIEPLAKAIYGKRGQELTSAEMATVLQAQQLQKSALTTQQAIAAAQRFLPNATVDQQLQLADALRSGTAASITPAASPGTTPAPAPATAAPGAPPAPSTPGQAPAAPPAPRTLSGVVPPTLGAASKETGKPVPVQVQQAIARTQSMNDNIDKALAALEPYKTDSSLEGTMKLVEKYRAGTEGDPFALAAAQLPDLAGLQQSASTTLGGASRSQRIYADKRQHTPRLPSGRQIMLAHAGLGANMVSTLSQLKEGDEGGFDSPAQMYQKLKGLRDANVAFLKDMQDATSRTPGGPPAPTGITPMPSHGPTPQAYQDAQGNWHIPAQ